MKKLLLALCLGFVVTSLFAQTVTPKREFRGVWVATVDNLDWPVRGDSPANQQAALISIFDKMKADGINVIVFQIRPECDALYQSALEPWSRWLTGTQGVAPNPLWDPLQFAVDEAHKRGMELHAWFNPYRAVKSIGNYTQASTHISNTHPEWLLTSVGDNMKYLNPGLPQVRDYVASVCADIVRRYNVDGLHADDYFYPYSPIQKEDTATFSAYNRGFTDIGDWRRDNVNLLMKAINDSIAAIKPWVKFGMSPFGIWKSNVPAGISGLDAYSVLYGDAIAWLQQHTVDYLSPQLYWAFGGGTDYAKLCTWWASQTQLYNRHLYTGQAPYHISDGSFATSEVQNQIRYNRATPGALGSLFFRAKAGLTDNPKGFADSLQNDLYKYPSIVPVMSWKETVPPNAPSNLAIQSTNGVLMLSWDAPVAASDGDVASRYVVYRFKRGNPTSADRDSARNIIGIAGTTSLVPAARIDEGGAQYYFTVASLDKNNNESAAMSNIVSMPASVAAPVLAAPADSAPTPSTGAVLQWNAVTGAAQYQLQVASDASFGPSSVLFTLNTSSLSYTITGLTTQKTYYWRVAAGTQLGSSSYSTGRSFTTAWPNVPVLMTPPIASNITRWPVFTWTKEGGTSFRFQLSSGTDYSTANIVTDTTLADSVYRRTAALQPLKQYRWRVMATNQYGQSAWAAGQAFRTNNETAVERDPIAAPMSTELMQNYPNPFNPSTTFRFTLASTAPVRLAITDILGRTVSVLVNETMPQGAYAVTWNASRVPSGIYFFTLNAGSYSMTRKLTLQK